VIRTVADDRERPRVTAFRETLDGFTLWPGVALSAATPTQEINQLRERLATARGDLPFGMVADETVIGYAELGRRIPGRCYQFGVPLVGWDLPWELGRLAAHTGRGRGGTAFSVTLLGCGIGVDGQWRDSFHYPRLRIEARGASQHGAFLRWVPAKDPGDRPKGHRPTFVDLSVLTAAVCGGEVAGPAEAARLLGTAWPEPTGDPIEDARCECAALVALYGAGTGALAELAPGLAPHQAWSTGSIVRHSRRRARIAPAAESMSDVPLATKGAVAGAFLGPRVEARLVGVATPMALVDLRSTYPGCFSALGLTRLLTAERIEFEDATEEFQAFLDAPDLTRRIFDPSTEKRWGATIVVLTASDGAVLPAMVEWAPGRVGGTVAPMRFKGIPGLSYSWCDVAHAVALGGTLTIERALRPVAWGTQRLRPYRMPDGVEVDLRRMDLGDAWRECRERMGTAVAKLGGNVDTFGAGAQHDRRVVARAVEVTGYSITGDAHSTPSVRPEVPAEDTSLLLAGAVTALCRMVVGLAIARIEAVGGAVAHVATDSIAVPASKEGGLWPCPGGSHRTADGREAIRLLRFDELRAILAESDALLGHHGSPAWKEECASLTEPTMGVVFGTNKVLLGRLDDGGEWQLVRSSDADLGGHLTDPTGTGERLDDGRWKWSADLERQLFVAAIDIDSARPIAMPPLPDFANRLAIRPGRATTWPELQQLRLATGDPTVMPLARFIQCEVGGRTGSPVALGHHTGPADWPSLDWRLDGAPVRLEILGDDGARQYSGGDTHVPRRVVVRTVADHLRQWLAEHDPSMSGPRRGLRSQVAVETDPSLVRLVGIDGEADADGRARPSTLTYGQLAPVAATLAASNAAALSRTTGIPQRTLRRYRSGQRTPRDEHAALIVSEALNASVRSCICGADLPGRRSDEKWCGDPCRKRHERARTPEDRADGMLRSLAIRIEGVASLEPAALAASPKLRPTIVRALDAGIPSDALVNAVAAFGPLTSARSPVGALVARIQQVTEHHQTAATQQAALRARGARSHGRLLGALVGVGEASAEEATAELDNAYADAELASIATAAYGEHG
jgi:hypothetical protein